MARIDGHVLAAVCRLEPPLSAFGELPFGLFALELPLAAACHTVTVRAEGSQAVERLRRRKLCPRTSGSKR